MSNVKGHQCINCTVSSCVYNDTQDCCCTLSSIQVAPNPNCQNGKACDECNCASYEAK